MVLLCIIDKGAPAQTLESGETRVYGVGASNATAMIRIRANGMSGRRQAGRAVRIGGGTLSAALNGASWSHPVDSFTGRITAPREPETLSCLQRRP